MNLSLLLSQQIVSMFIMLIFGFLLVQFKLLKSEDSKTLSLLLLYVVIPCTIINSFQIQYTSEKLTGLGIAFLGSIIVHIIFIPLTVLANKIFHLKQIEQASLIYSNAGNLIIPLVGAILGKEWVFYCSAYIAVQTFLLWTHGKAMICGKKDMNLKNILLNVSVISIGIGIILFLTRFQLPVIIKSSIENTGSMIGPLSMIIIGMLIGEMNLKEVFLEKRTYLICFGRLILYPMIVVLVFSFSGLINLNPDAKSILAVVLLAASAPAAATITQFAQVYDKGAKDASIINVMSVIFCIVTMPLVIMFYELFI